ncbi:uncharacterized protein BXZ73DRAFT_79988 [Epithele typhae]|uniref:uncharacterized protein n=1 Tax=Epithele typhae TaxID=378194 RepID=UPI00200774B6|nr:uncharacterized protein BXZ73DRAFT_79988 [Epithele typhae]KAH9921217.1 hypothetical protein BXZ73DRAFT_79988 [Epithele typhae]
MARRRAVIFSDDDVPTGSEEDRGSSPGSPRRTNDDDPPAWRVLDTNSNPYEDEEDDKDKEDDKDEEKDELPDEEPEEQEPAAAPNAPAAPPAPNAPATPNAPAGAADDSGHKYGLRQKSQHDAHPARKFGVHVRDRRDIKREADRKRDEVAAARANKQRAAVTRAEGLNKVAEMQAQRQYENNAGQEAARKPPARAAIRQTVLESNAARADDEQLFPSVSSTSQHSHSTPHASTSENSRTSKPSDPHPRAHDENEPPSTRDGSLPPPVYPIGPPRRRKHASRPNCLVVEIETCPDPQKTPRTDARNRPRTARKSADSAHEYEDEEQDDETDEHDGDNNNEDDDDNAHDEHERGDYGIPTPGLDDIPYEQDVQMLDFQYADLNLDNHESDPEPSINFNHKGKGRRKAPTYIDDDEDTWEAGGGGHRAKASSLLASFAPYAFRKPMSQKEKKSQRREVVRTALESQGAAIPKRPRSDTVASRSASAKKFKPTGPVMNKNWEQDTPAPASRTPTPASSSHLASWRARQMRHDVPDLTSTFGDHLRRDDIFAASKKGGSRRMKSLVSVETADASGTPDNSEDESPAKPPPKRRRKRTAVADVPLDVSRSNKKLPAWCTGDVKKVYLASVIDILGTKCNPLDTADDHGDDLLDACIEARRRIYPTDDTELTKKSQLYIAAGNEMYPWRSKFVKVGCDAVEAEYTKELGPGCTAPQVAAWARARRDRQSAAFYKIGATKKAYQTPAKGIFGSTLILRTFAHHLDTIAKSRMDLDFPFGALALAAFTVDHCLSMYETGVQLPANAGFGSRASRNKVQEWYEDRVSCIIDNPEKQDLILQGANGSDDDDDSGAHFNRDSSPMSSY